MKQSESISINETARTINTKKESKFSDQNPYALAHFSSAEDVRALQN